MKLSQLCLGSVAIITVYSGQLMAAPPPSSFDEWTIVGTISAETCAPGYSCGSVLTDGGFFQRMITENSTGETFFQTIITETESPSSETLADLLQSDSSFTVGLTCPNGHVCGDIIIGPNFQQQEVTDGTGIWYQTLSQFAITPTSNQAELGEPTPLHLFHAETGRILKPGHHLISNAGNTLAQQASNLHLNRTNLTADPDYIESNLLSDVEERIYRKIVDVEITGIENGSSSQLSAQLSTPLKTPDGYLPSVRVLTTQGWQDFVSDDHNHLAAAAKLESGYCPEVNSSAYENNFGSGNECLRINIQDGGPNDGDGEPNGSVALTAGVILKEAQPSLEPTPDAKPTLQSSAQNSGGGGGAWSWWLSIALLARLGRSSAARRIR